MSNPSAPVHNLVIYRPKQGHYDQLKAILLQHGPALAKSGLLAEGKPGVQLWTARDLPGRGSPDPYFVESFWWRDDKAGGLAHQMPVVMSVWETMGPHLENMTISNLDALTP